MIRPILTVCSAYTAGAASSAVARLASPISSSACIGLSPRDSAARPFYAILALAPPVGCRMTRPLGLPARAREIDSPGPRAGAARSALPLPLLAVEVEGFHHRRVGEAEEEGGLAARVGVLVERPRGHREHVLVLPFEALAADQGIARAFDHVIVRAADVAMGLGVLPGAEQLHV